MVDATQSGADSQTATDSDFASLIAAQHDEIEFDEEGRDQAAPEASNGDEGQAEDATQDAPQDETFTLKVDGEEVVLTKDELIAEAQKSRAASKRLEEASHIRRQAEAQAQQVMQERTQERNQVAQVLNRYVGELQTLMNRDQPNWRELSENDPTEYVRQQVIWGERQAQLQQAQAEQSYLAQQQQFADEHARNQTFQRTLSDVKTMVPEWQDEAKFKAGISDLNAFLTKQGVPDAQQPSLFSAPLVKIFRDAHAYQQMLSKQQPALKKVAALPPKVEKTGQGIRTTDGRSAAMQKLNKSGRTEDAAALIANMFL
jgi:hypothetical protein